MLPRLRAFARSLAGTRDAADELVQATCERALRAASRFEPGTRLDSWLFRIMRNRWIDEHRARRPHASLDDPCLAPALELESARHEEPDERLRLGEVRAALGRLPEAQRSVLVLVCVQGLSYREAAAVLDVPVGTVMSRLARARAAVSAALGENKGGGEDRGREGGDG
ncbi:RNA polymerase sigma factor [Pararoseomonas sp. SCSIO 73927]|uniref:RNA polymerase sigma factor n=1 Tax=Pararoseomonas sp. SCSIO 73927 TaxID=3114537 RepID=UPI0030D027B2